MAEATFVVQFQRPKPLEPVPELKIEIM